MSAIQLFDLNGEQRFTGTSLGGFQSATVMLTDAQIKALPTTPVAIIPPPGAGKAVYCPVATGSGMAIMSLHRAADYTNIDPTLVVSFRYQDNNNIYGNQDFTDSAGFFAWGDTDGPVWPINPATESSAGDIVNSASVFATSSIVIALRNGVLGNLTGGDAANALTVTVYYTVVAVA